MTNSTWKIAIAAVLASSGFLAFACGGGEAEGGGATTPSATTTATETTPPATASATASATATATATPPPPTLPDSFKTAEDARTKADAAWTAILTDKETKCDALATKVTKFTKDNEAAYQTWNGEYSKLSDDQKKLVTAKAPAADTSAATGGFKACMDKKDKKLTAAVAATDAGMKKMPGAAAPAGSGSAAPAGSGKPPAKK